jgi:hypothetical protein
MAIMKREIITSVGQDMENWSLGVIHCGYAK